MKKNDGLDATIVQAAGEQANRRSRCDHYAAGGGEDQATKHFKKKETSANDVLAEAV
ncbi:hypothetical protein [Larkinella punicea]|uniref:hypothetical protein n=1 Tax=Larkinella punicea TaxID=2315727 RepID=UPI001403C9AD|nr:hypothetical protein [Larkinella punicea]